MNSLTTISPNTYDMVNGKKEDWGIPHRPEDREETQELRMSSMSFGTYLEDTMTLQQTLNRRLN